VLGAGNANINKSLSIATSSNHRVNQSDLGSSGVQSPTGLRKTKDEYTGEMSEDSNRPPIATSPGHSQYNRLKYYSALRTGYQQLGSKEDFLRIPKHVIDPILYVIYAPFAQMEPGQKQSSLTTIFTCWNTMIGSGIVALPWTFSNSGFLLGIVICIVSLLVSYRTCILMIRTAGNDKEYFDTLFKYWGRWAYYIGIFSTLLIMFAAVCSYFVILSQMLYPIILALI
jgi:hypothetical protein